MDRNGASERVGKLSRLSLKLVGVNAIILGAMLIVYLAAYLFFFDSSKSSEPIGEAFAFMGCLVYCIGALVLVLLPVAVVGEFIAWKALVVSLRMPGKPAFWRCGLCLVLHAVPLSISILVFLG